MPSKIAAIVPVEEMVLSRSKKVVKTPKDLIDKVSPMVWQDVSVLKTIFKEPKRWPLRLLLDTPTLDYLIRDPYRLSQLAVVAINEPGIAVYVSECSWLELAEKMKLGLYSIRGNFGEFMQQVMSHYKLQLLPMDGLALEKYRNLQAITPVSKRMVCGWLAAQAMATNCTIVSPDGHFEAFRSQGIKQLW